MATFDAGADRVMIEIVYFGPPGSGKTTNLEGLSSIVQSNAPRRITPQRVGGNRVFAIDVPAGSLGAMMGRDIVVRAVTVQGVVAEDDVWTRLLYDADGIVFVASSSSAARADNARAVKRLRSDLQLRQDVRAEIPILLQWNKRDLEDARPIGQLQNQLNDEGYPSVPATAIRGLGVASTFTEIVTRAVIAKYREAGGPEAGESALERSLAQAFARTGEGNRRTSDERFGATIPLRSVAEPSPARPVRSGPKKEPTV